MIPLLPYEKQIAEMIGVSEEEYQQWKALTLKRSIQRPAQGPVCGPLVPVLANLAVATGFTLLSNLLFPTRRQGEVNVTRLQGSQITANQRLSPRFGFNSIQEPARVGQFVPVVIAKRENGLGGVRVNMPLLWSQILAWKGSQMARLIFLAGSAAMPANAWDSRGWALGNNTLGAYSYASGAMSTGARYSIYFSRDGGRITSSDLIAGKSAALDTGNASNYGGEDVYAVNTGGGQYKRAFCMSETPSTSSAFGIYGWCPNAMMRRAAVTIQPTIVASIGDDGKVKTDDDAAALVETWKGKFFWSARGGLRYINGVSGATGDFEIAESAVNIGDLITYVLEKNTDADTKIRIDFMNSRVNFGNAASEEAMSGIASSVAGIQNSADSSLIPGELYRIGSCWAVLEERVSENPVEAIFISNSENEPVGGGNTMYYNFRVVRPGSVQFVGPGFLNPPPIPVTAIGPGVFWGQVGNTIWPIELFMWPLPAYLILSDIKNLPSGTEGRYKVCSAASQVFRMAIASFGAVREFKTCEMIIRSRVGISVNGMTGFRESPTILWINAIAGQNQVDITTTDLDVSRYDSGGSSITTKCRRYSLFVFEYSADRGETWTQFPEFFAVAGIGGEEVYNYLRSDFPSYKRWERRLVPVSSWEIRRTGLNKIIVLDTNSGQEIGSSYAGVTVTTTGYIIDPTSESRRKLSQLEPAEDLGFGWSDPGYQSMFDGYASFAEAFPYDNLQTSVGNAPEHQVTQINYYGDLEFVPSYESLAITGLNIVAALEIDSLPSFSGFCNNGYEMPRLLNNDTKGSSHLWPDWLREVMTNPELGPFPRVQSVQIDRASFQGAAQWCQDRKYFYDTVEEEPLDTLNWASYIALAHLLKLVRIGGVYYLEKAINFDFPLEIKAQFNNGNIEEGSFKLNSVGFLERQPFIVQVKWREESTGAESPLFPRERVATVRQASTSPNAPIKTLDFSKWCTNYKQAIDAACYYIRFVTLRDHSINFTTSPEILAAQLRSGGCFIMDIDVINYNTTFQGFIKADGTIVSTRPWDLPATSGEYEAITWNTQSNPQEETITITGQTASPVNRFFAIRETLTRPRTYEIKKINIDPEGVISIDAFHHPTDANGFSLLGINWTTYETDANWVIEGADLFGTGTPTGSLPIIALSVSPASVPETSTTGFTFTFTRVGSTTNSLAVNFAVGGTAVFGTDYSQTGAAFYSASSGTVILPAGISSKIVTIIPILDVVSETNETVSITIQNGPGYSVGTTAAVTGTITNVYVPPSDPNIDKRYLLLKMEGPSESTTFIDSSMYGNTIYNGGSARITTASYRFGSSSGQFNSDDGYIYTSSDTIWNCSGIAFTWEFWFNLQFFFQYSRLLSQRINLFAIPPFEIVYSEKQFAWYIGNSDLTGWQANGATSSILEINANQWYYLRLTGDGSALQLQFQDTVILRTLQPAWPSGPRTAYIGGGIPGGGIIRNVKLDEVRFTRGIAETGPPPIVEFFAP